MALLSYDRFTAFAPGTYSFLFYDWTVYFRHCEWHQMGFLNHWQFGCLFTSLSMIRENVKAPHHRCMVWVIQHDRFPSKNSSAEVFPCGDVIMQSLSISPSFRFCSWRIFLLFSAVLNHQYRIIHTTFFLLRFRTFMRHFTCCLALF